MKSVFIHFCLLHRRSVHSSLCNKNNHNRISKHIHILSVSYFAHSTFLFANTLNVTCLHANAWCVLYYKVNVFICKLINMNMNFMNFSLVFISLFGFKIAQRVNQSAFTLSSHQFTLKIHFHNKSLYFTRNKDDFFPLFCWKMTPCPLNDWLKIVFTLQ